jgi:hypothetical protein
MDKALTVAEERFLDYIMRGDTHKNAYNLAFPDNTLSPTSQRDAGFKLFHEPRVQRRYKELSANLLSELQNKRLWDKEKAVRELTDILEANKREVQRYEDAYVMEMNLIENAIKKKQEEITNPKGYLSEKKKEYIESEIDLLLMNKIKCNRRHQSNKNANEAMLNCIQQLNKIYEIGDTDKNKLSLDANISFVEDLNGNSED